MRRRNSCFLSGMTSSDGPADANHHGSRATVRTAPLDENRRNAWLDGPTSSGPVRSRCGPATSATCSTGRSPSVPGLAVAGRRDRDSQVDAPRLVHGAPPDLTAARVRREVTHMRPIPAASLAIPALLAAGLSSCVAPLEVECGEDAHCDLFPGGLCHTNPETARRWCSYPDPACSTGYRYSDLSGDGVSGGCTGEPPARCDPTADFGDPTLVPNVNSSLDEVDIKMTHDERVAFVGRITGSTFPQLTSERASVDIDFPVPAEKQDLAEITAPPGAEAHLYPTGDGLVLFFTRYGDSQNSGLYAAFRSSRSDPFGSETRVTIDGSPMHASRVFGISGDGQTLYWEDSLRVLKASARRHAFYEFGGISAITLSPFHNAIISANGLTLYYGYPDILVTTRASKDVSFGTGVPLPNVNTVYEDTPRFVSVDECVLYLVSNRSGGFGGSDIWVARRPR
jgi:hypothetical protein